MSSSTHRRAHWPPRWALKNGAIRYRPRDDERALWDGKSWFKLGTTEQEAWRTWYERTAGAPTQPLQTMADAIDRYRHEILPDLAPKTQRDYARALVLLRGVFGRMRPADIRPTHVYAYMDRRPGVAGNRERAVLSAVISRCVEWGMVERNLVREVRRRTEKPRDRYVADGEVAAFLAHCSPLLAAYVRLKLLTGLRQGQLLHLRRADWDATSGELRAAAAKGGREVIYSGDGLLEAVTAIQDATSTGANVASLWLIPNRSGRPYTGDGFRTLWQRAMRAHVDAGGERFREHDLRAKVASDAEAEHARALMGHRTAITERVYRRKPHRVSVLRTQS